MTPPPPSKTPWKKRLQQLGWGAFLFFLIKGLVWLAVLWGLGSWFEGCG